MRHFLSVFVTKSIRFEKKNLQIFTNMNTPEDYQSALKVKESVHA